MATNSTADWQIVTYNDIAQSALYKQFDFTSYKRAVKFTDAIAAIAETHNHHPDILLRYGSVSVWSTTHSVKKITEKDKALVHDIEIVYQKSIA